MNHCTNGPMADPYNREQALIRERHDLIQVIQLLRTCIEQQYLPDMSSDCYARILDITSDRECQTCST
jgi:hypothetical protein